MKKLCLFLIVVLLISTVIPGIVVSDALADSGRIYSGGAIDSSGQFSLTADEFMEELICIMNSDTALIELENKTVSLDPEFSYSFLNEHFYVLQYSGVEVGSVSFLKNGIPASGQSRFDSVGIQVPVYYGFSTFFLIDACCSAVFLTAPACNYNDAMLVFAALLGKAREDGQNSYAETSTELFSYSVESFIIDETDNTEQYLFIISQV